MISVIMPVYNVEDYVAEAIESVRQQSYGEWELLLIDDGSTDESSKICKAYAEEIEKIFEKGLNHEAVTALECDQYKTAFLLFIAKEYKRLGWVMQLHDGCKRDNNTTMRSEERR